MNRPQAIDAAQMRGYGIMPAVFDPVQIFGNLSQLVDNIGGYCEIRYERHQLPTLVEYRFSTIYMYHICITYIS